MDSIGAVMRHSIIGLALFAALTAGLIALTQAGTLERIQAAEEAARGKALLEIVPASQTDTPLLQGAFTIEDATALGFAGTATAYRIRREGQTTGVILPWQAPEGYSGPIQGIVAIDRQGTILGARVTNHRETPGLGDRIERRKSPWITIFEGLSFANLAPDQWKVRKDGGSIDQLTGATITPRAIVKAIREALHYHQDHVSLLYPDASEPPLPLTEGGSTTP